MNAKEIANLCTSLPFLLNESFERINLSAKALEMTPSQHTRASLVTQLYVAYSILSDVRKAVITFNPDADEDD